MSSDVKYLPEALKDLRKLDGNQRLIIRKAICKVSKNPYPINKGGYGKPLGNKNNTNLSGFLKVKLRNAGLRIVYQLIEEDEIILIIVTGIREDEEVYKLANKQILKYKL